MILKIIGWAFGLIAIAMIGYYFDNGEILAGIICLFAAGFFIPPMLNKINKHSKGKAEAKGNTYKELSLTSGIFCGLFIFIIAGFVGAPEGTDKENIKELIKNTPEQTPDEELDKPIDLTYQLLSMVEELEYWFKGEYQPHQKRQFVDVRNKYDKRLTKLCDKFDQITKKTGNLNSEYNDEFKSCRNFQMLLIGVLQNLNNGNYEEIPKLRNEFEPQYQSLKEQIDKERERIQQAQ